MSRLAEQQKKQFTTKIIIVILVLVAVVILIFTVGLKILLNTSVFVAKLSEKSQSPLLNKNQNFIGDVDIVNIPTATNSSRIIVEGGVVNFNQIEFYLNGDLVKETSLLTSDNFSEEIGDLAIGENEVYIIGKSKEENEEKKSKVYTVFYKSEKPRLEVSEPQDGLKTVKQELEIKGLTDKETYIKVNDLPVVVDAQGTFQTTVKLNEGENKIFIKAQDVAGNSEEKTLTVIYEKE
ncbi:hypothetical protein A3C98_03600 [Candidatus Roizmanbacteria bacterium RIFCSPHIGHO2_02_FULL_37_15]|uniref:Bacterial Ig domain-containing protein n=1 Tax=Candidatus Roizmanbacteria bacterium RIFCSPLOWO2_01_FULL_37_16 TaxID=1802058 RepID=A0A1F7IIW6_9BACT|nr:MAG: hypothetical protein A3C98_03600 [Candidatus Roizmanbacteria bacterium RIFCSPHIGHO2_02_FULL_37_15]OGK43308.1 MAG: hypothetical protein A3B40_02340 [Candidatus Roizmanbacteria bacterium RIFCSPLOWO2_01_FULL_37_16]OGK56877.1 MAG: hypothetical protein A3I50_05140 [Candidatus Roizmanbacteria bacterium RIFCSPLOWO2_02_FULL_37_9]